MLVNEIVTQLEIGHSVVQSIIKFVFIEFPDHCSSILILPHRWQKWEMCGGVVEHPSDIGYRFFSACAFNINMLTGCGMTTISFMNFMICVLY